jgi:hypothetical protein
MPNTLIPPQVFADRRARQLLADEQARADRRVGIEVVEDGFVLTGVERVLSVQDLVTLYAQIGDVLRRDGRRDV